MCTHRPAADCRDVLQRHLGLRERVARASYRRRAHHAQDAHDEHPARLDHVYIYIVMAYVVMAYVVMTYIVMAYFRCKR